MTSFVKHCQVCAWVFAFSWSAQVASLADTAPSPYAGQESRAVKALSERETADLLAGRGMGYALAAELNRYPGPSHVIELADKLALTAAQRKRTQEVFEVMQSQAKAIGAEIITAEQKLDTVFATGTIDQASLTVQTAALGQLYGQWRATHLAAHIEMKTLLTPQQIAAYDHMRGYSATSPGATPAPHNHGHR